MCLFKKIYNPDEPITVTSPVLLRGGKEGACDLTLSAKSNVNKTFFLVFPSHLSLVEAI